MYFLLHLSLWNFVLFMLYDYPGRIIISWFCFIGWILLHSFRKKGTWVDKYKLYGLRWLIPSIYIHTIPLKMGDIIIQDIYFSLVLLVLWYILLLYFDTTPMRLYHVMD